MWFTGVLNLVTMRRASGLWPRFEGVVLGARGVGYGRTPAVGMASQESPGANPAEREAFRFAFRLYLYDHL